jgi:hypothetical protein
MRRLMLLASAALVLGATCAAPASAGWRVGVGIGIGFPLCGPGYCAPYYPYYPYYYYPPPVVVQPAPLVAQPAYAVPAAPAAPALAAPTAPAAPAAPAGSSAPEVVVAPVPRPAPADAREADINRRIEHLSNPNAQARADVAIDLGRMKAEKAVDALIGTLSRDASPVVREASARALGLIGSPRALPALQHAAQADEDRDVRNSARFAADVIQTNR